VGVWRITPAGIDSDITAGSTFTLVNDYIWDKSTNRQVFLRRYA
jgi:hypothetical protein